MKDVHIFYWHTCTASLLGKVSLHGTDTKDWNKKHKELFLRLVSGNHELDIIFGELTPYV